MPMLAVTESDWPLVSMKAPGNFGPEYKAAFDGIEPSWLPDGRHLVYTARDRSTSVLCILDTETGQSKRVSPTNLGPLAQASVLAQ